MDKESVVPNVDDDRLSSGTDARSVRSPGRILPLRKRLVFALVPVLVLMSGAECAQRVRYAVGYGRVDYLTYGFGYARDVGGAGESSAPATPAAVAQQLYVGGRVIVIPPRAPAGCPAAMSPTARVILAVGGSSMRGIYNDESHTFPSLLEQAMNVQVGRPAFAVCNLGVPGMDSVGYGEVIQDTLARVTPRLVIFYTGFNDTYADLGPFRPGFGSPAMTVGKWLQGRSLLWLTASEKYTFWYEQRWPRYRDPSEMQQRFENLRANLMGEVGRLRAKDVDVLLVPEVVMDNTLFEGFWRHGDLGIIWFQQTPGIIRDVAAASGSEFVSLQDGFSRNNVGRFFRDPVHLTDEGNRRLVELLLERSRLVQDVIRAERSQAGPAASVSH